MLVKMGVYDAQNGQTVLWSIMIDWHAPTLSHAVQIRDMNRNYLTKALPEKYIFFRTISSISKQNRRSMREVAQTLKKISYFLI